MLKIIRDKYLLNDREFPKTHEKSIEMICEMKKLSVINFNYKMVQMEAPCKIIRVSHSLIKISSAIKLEGEGIRYRRQFSDL